MSEVRKAQKGHKFTFTQALQTKAVPSRGVLGCRNENFACELLKTMYSESRYGTQGFAFALWLGLLMRAGVAEGRGPPGARCV